MSAVPRMTGECSPIFIFKIMKPLEPVRTHPKPHAERLQALRAAMAQHGIHACLIASADPHLSEYLPAHWQIRNWLTGFTGSVGTVIVTMDQAGLWVDSRYWVQAERELAGSGFELQRIQSALDTSYLQWLGRNLVCPAVLAVDARTLSVSTGEALRQALPDAVTLRLDLDLPGEIWMDRPELPLQPVYALSPQVACQTMAEKLASVRARMREYGATHHLVSTVDDIAWMLNLRGSDVTFNPVFLAHLLVNGSGASLYVDERKLSASIRQSLFEDGVEVLPYEAAPDALRNLDRTDRLLFDPRRVVCALVDDCVAARVLASNPSTLLKARKSEAEMANWREIMCRDGAALCEFFAWLEAAIATRDQRQLDELMIDKVLTDCRARQEGFVSRSFATIAAFRVNGAMPHYRATPASYAVIEGDGLLLIDSGGQYEGGTTDITRVVPVGELPEQARMDCTAVLRAMIALSRARFPQGLAAPLLDAVARAPLWERMLDYGHGTGHGVGYFLNVHEGPQVLSYKAPVHPDMALMPGMVTSNEPGLYRPGLWGVRIENLVCCRVAGQSEFGQFLEFETLTLCPIDTRCFMLDMLNNEEIAWLNDYHQHVRQTLEPRLKGAALQWLLDRTEPLSL